jgi:hypothetical protein
MVTPCRERPSGALLRSKYRADQIDRAMHLVYGFVVVAGRNEELVGHPQQL